MNDGPPTDLTDTDDGKDQASPGGDDNADDTRDVLSASVNSEDDPPGGEAEETPISGASNTDVRGKSETPSTQAPAGGLRSVIFAGLAGDLPVLDAFLAARDSAAVLRLWFGDLTRQFADDPERVVSLLARDIAEIDEALTRQLNAILHHRSFQKLEATWRGAALLVSSSDEIENAVIRILTVKWAEIARDLDRAVEFDQSQMFAKIYSEEFDTPGGTPYGLIVADFEVAHKPRAGHTVDDVSVLTGLSQVAMAAFSPIVVGCAPELFGLETFRELGLPIDLRTVLDQQEYRRFNRLRKTEEARFLALVAPHILLRRPYTPKHDSEIGFPYSEERFGSTLRDQLWGNAGFAYATVVLRAFGQYGWFANIRGARRDQIGAGMVTCLPNLSFSTDRTGIAGKYCTDVSITDKVENDLNDLGFIALANAKDTDYAIFYGNQSLHIPREMTNSAATANERLSSMVRYILCISRFAHYVKIMVRDRVGRFETPESIEEHLSKWLMNYTTANDRAGEDMKARYPLRDGSVQVRDEPGRPGAYKCIINVQPHFQLDQVVSSFRLITELNNVGVR